MKGRPVDQSDGFGLIEVLTVVVIIGILAAIAVPLFLSQRAKAKDAAVKEGVHVLKVGIVSYAADHDGAVPPSGDLDVLKGTYVSHWPVNPFTGNEMTQSSAPAAGSYDYAVADGEFTLKGWLKAGSFDVSGAVSSAVASVAADGGPGAPGGGSGSSTTPPSADPEPAGSADASPSASPTASPTAAPSETPDPEATKPALDSSFAAVSGDLIERLEAYHAKHGRWPKSSPYAALGVDPDVLDEPIGGVLYELTGSRILVGPAKGYRLTFTDQRGKDRSVEWRDDKHLIYDAEEEAWFNGTVRDSNRVDISTLAVKED